MKVANVVIKVLVALAAVAGAVYVIATYGEQIVAWAKKVLNSMSGGRKCCCSGNSEEAPAEEAAETVETVEETPVEEAAPAVEEPETAEPEEGAVVAEDADFEG